MFLSFSPRKVPLNSFAIICTVTVTTYCPCHFLQIPLYVPFFVAAVVVIALVVCCFSFIVLDCRSSFTLQDRERGKTFFANGRPLFSGGL